MVGADGDARRPRWRWDVALSFAGAQRDYVEQVARALQAREVSCFYDADEQIELWGKYLAEELPAIYSEQAAAVVVFVSAEYAARDWTRLERRAALNRAVRQRREYVLPARFDDTPLPGLLSDMVAVDLRTRTPEQFAAVITAKLATLDVTALGPSESSASDAGMAWPPGAVRACEADLRRLGVHAAISVPGLPDEVPPEYVPRDADTAEHGVRAKVAAAAERGGFVLLVGGSSVGKTRCAAEAVKELLPDWWLVHPADPAEVAALAAAPVPRVVVWLDELQRYLDGEGGLTGGVVRALLGAPGPAVIIGMLWPDRYTAYTTVPAPGGADPHAREREVLDLAAVVRIAPQFTPAEQDRARAAAARDRRLKIALESSGYGLTQTLAAAPQLVTRWQDARDGSPYAWAVLTAALDAARLGARAPLSADLLRAAAPGYCTSQQQAEAPENWFEQALAYATAKLHGAAAALRPAGSGMGQVAGYTAADYLIQHASRERRYARVPASTWNAILGHTRNPDDAARLADAARDRLLYRYAKLLYQHALDAGYTVAAERLAYLLGECWDLDGLRARADTGDEHAAWNLAWRLAIREDLDELRARADDGDSAAAGNLARLLARREDLDELRARADAGEKDAARELANLLAKRGDLDRLRARAVTGDEHAARRLTELLAKRGDLDGLRGRADDGDSYAAKRLGRLLADHGDLDGAVQLLRAEADAGEKDAIWLLADLLADHGDLDGAVGLLRARAKAGDGSAASRLAKLRAKHGDLDELRARADAGEKDAIDLLIRLLAGRGELDELRARADTGNKHAVGELDRLLAKGGELDELRARADTGDGSAAHWLAKVLAGRWDLDGLRARADIGEWSSAYQLAELLAERGDLDGLRARANDGDEPAAMRLAELLAKRGQLDEAIQIMRPLADAGDEGAEANLLELLAERGDIDELRVRAVAARHGVYWVVILLAKRGQLDEAVQILLDRAEVGNGDAEQLADVLIKQGRSEEAERLWRFGLNPDGSIACR